VGAATRARDRQEIQPWRHVSLPGVLCARAVGSLTSLPRRTTLAGSTRKSRRRASPAERSLDHVIGPLEERRRGIVRPRALAVLRLMTNSTVVGRSMDWSLRHTAAHAPVEVVRPSGLKLLAVGYTAWFATLKRHYRWPRPKRTSACISSSPCTRNGAIRFRTSSRRGRDLESSLLHCRCRYCGRGYTTRYGIPYLLRDENVAYSPKAERPAHLTGEVPTDQRIDRVLRASYPKFLTSSDRPGVRLVGIDPTTAFTVRHLRHHGLEVLGVGTTVERWVGREIQGAPIEPLEAAVDSTAPVVRAPSCPDRSARARCCG
jgi:hypothetical protein